MKSSNIQVQPSFFQRNKMPILIGGVVVLIGGGVLTYFLLNKKKKNNEKQANDTPNFTASIPPVSGSSSTPPYVPTRSGTQPPTRSTSSKAIIKYGSRGSLVHILQRYLKVFGEDLGKTGSNRDGVDGIFGKKTAGAAKKRLGKTVFTTADIEKMKKALTTLGK